MVWWLVLIIFFVYMFLEFFISFLFNYKIYLITEKRYNIASLLGALSTFFNALLIGFAAYFSIETGNNLENWWLILVTSGAMAVGNFFAALSVPKVKKIIRKKIEKKKAKK